MGQMISGLINKIGDTPPSIKRYEKHSFSDIIDNIVWTKERFISIAMLSCVNRNIYALSVPGSEKE